MRSSSHIKAAAFVLVIILSIAMVLLIPVHQPAFPATYWTQANTNGFGGGDSTVYCMATYNSKLYAGTDNYAAIWQYNTGTSWTRINSAGFGDYGNGGVSSMKVSGGILYVGTYNTSTGAEVWAYDGTSWSQVNQDGFGYNFTLYKCCALEVFNGNLYAVVSSNGGKFRVYKYSGSNTAWTQVDTGAWDSNNYVGLCAKSFGGYLWVGTENMSTGTEI